MNDYFINILKIIFSVMILKSYKLTHEEIEIPMQILKLEASVYLYVGNSGLNFENLLVSIKNSK